MTSPATTDPERPDPPPIPDIPAVTDLPRGPDVEHVAKDLLAAVTAWAPAAAAAVDFHGAAEVRRRLAPVAATVYRRGESRAAVLDMQHAARLVDRVCGLTIEDGRRAGLIRTRQGRQHPDAVQVKDIGVDVPVVTRMSRPSWEEFHAAIEAGRAAGSLAADALCGHLGVEHLTEAQSAQRDRMTELAAEGHSTEQIAAAMGLARGRAGGLLRRYGVTVPGDTVRGTRRTVTTDRIFTGVIPQIEGVASALSHITAEDYAAMDPADAKRWGQELWDALTPVMRVMRELRTRGKGDR